jgi:hypothetical protein
MPLLLPQARDHLVLCLFPIGQRTCQCLATTFSQPHQVPATVRPCLNSEEPHASSGFRLRASVVRSITSASAN